MREETTLSRQGTVSLPCAQFMRARGVVLALLGAHEVCFRRFCVRALVGRAHVDVSSS